MNDYDMETRMKRFKCCAMILFLTSIYLFVSCGGNESNSSNDEAINDVEDYGGDGGNATQYAYYKCEGGYSYYCMCTTTSSTECKCHLVDWCLDYGCNISSGQCYTSIPNDSDKEQQTPTEFPECTSAGLTPCKDSSTGLVWSGRSSYEMSWSMAVDYCNNLYKGGYGDWRLPNIDELRTLVENCPNIETGGNCQVSEKNGSLSGLYLDWSACMRCGDNSNYSNKLNEKKIIWSSSTVEEKSDQAWYLAFSSPPEISYAYKYEDCEYETYNMCVVFTHCVRRGF